MPIKPTTLLACALPILNAACATIPTGATSAGVCAQWRPITWSRRDTPDTVDQVKGGNARRTAWCR